MWILKLVWDQYYGILGKRFGQDKRLIPLLKLEMKLQVLHKVVEE